MRRWPGEVVRNNLAAVRTVALEEAPSRGCPDPVRTAPPLEARRHRVTDPPIIRKAIGAAAIGNITEWFDFGVYAYFEPTIKAVFFADLGDTAGTIATFGLFAVAFLVRPFGGMFFGPLADRIGRNKVLATTMILMALGTFAIGCIPSQSSIGILAPILLLVARLVQGFSTGGEYGNAMTFIAEYAPDKRRGFLGSWLEFGTFTGYLMGALSVTVVSALLTDDQLLSWGWRLPFFIALPLGIVGVYLRTPARRYAGVRRDGEGVRGAGEGQQDRRRGQAAAPAVALRAGLHGSGDRLERHQLHAHLLHADLRHRHRARRRPAAASPPPPRSGCRSP